VRDVDAYFRIRFWALKFVAYGKNRFTVNERILGRCNRYDTGTYYMSPTNHVIVLKCLNASKNGRQAYTGCYLRKYDKPELLQF